MGLDVLGLDQNVYFLDYVRLGSLGLDQTVYVRTLEFEISLKNKFQKKYEGFFELPVKLPLKFKHFKLKFSFTLNFS